MGRLKTLCRRAEELGVEEQAADYLEELLDAAEEALEAYEENREEDAEVIVEACIPMPAVLATLGTLARVEYDRDEGGEPVRRYHDFEDERPMLAYDPQNGGQLWIVGGDYRVTSRGIVG